jgi:hypothetical protein
MAKMEDSPLSITASIAGILTFIAALCTFIYVRAKTLRNAREEISTILESVTATIEETHTIQAAQPAPITPVREGSDADRLQKLMKELYSIELEIMARCMNVLTRNLKSLGAESLPHNMAYTTRNDVLQEMAGVSRKKTSGHGRLTTTIQLIAVATGLMASGSLWGEILLPVFSLGMTPTMVRWYIVRKRVLELVQQREIIRSRLLFHQISVAAS